MHVWPRRLRRLHKKAEEERIAREEAEAAPKKEEERLAEEALAKEAAEAAQKVEEERIAREEAEAAQKIGKIGGGGSRGRTQGRRCTFGHIYGSLRVYLYTHIYMWILIYTRRSVAGFTARSLSGCRIEESKVSGPVVGKVVLAAEMLHRA